MATRDIQQETSKATSLLVPCGTNGHKPQQRLQSMQANLVRAFKRCTLLKLFQGDQDAFAAYLGACDPSLNGKYLRWLMNRLAKQTPNRLFDLDFTDEGESARKTLLAFQVKTQYLPIEQRDILSYLSLKEVDQVVAENEDRFNHISYALLDSLNTLDVIEQTRVMEHDGYSVHQPRTIEEAALMLTNDVWLDGRKKGFYGQLKSLGTVYIFLSDFGPMIGVLPRGTEERGVVYDSTGEQSMFEDALMLHDLSYEDAPEIIELLCKIDPALPFDEEMDEIEPFLAALNQFPLVLMEDRELTDEQIEELLAHPQLSDAARNVIEEIVE
jgi:hypothetical protein